MIGKCVSCLRPDVGICRSCFSCRTCTCGDTCGDCERCENCKCSHECQCQCNQCMGEGLPCAECRKAAEVCEECENEFDDDRHEFCDRCSDPPDRKICTNCCTCHWCHNCSGGAWTAESDWCENCEQCNYCEGCCECSKCEECGGLLVDDHTCQCQVKARVKIIDDKLLDKLVHDKAEFDLDSSLKDSGWL